MQPTKRRQFLGLIGLSGFGLAIRPAHAHHTDTHFDDKSAHQLVYQCNRADHDYLDGLLFSCGEMLRKYGDDIELVIAAYGPGLNLLAKQPSRAITEEQKDRVESLSQYGVRFQACGNTMKTMKWKKEDIFDEAEIVPIGIDGIMLLQEKGFSYISM